MARPRASKPGPRLAEVAGRRRWKGLLGLGANRGWSGHAGCGWLMWDSRVRRTTSGSASRTMGGLRRAAWRA